MTNQWARHSPGNGYICHKCAYIKTPADLVVYGKYRLCRDCARKYENLKEKDHIGNIEAFVIID